MHVRQVLIPVNPRRELTIYITLELIKISKTFKAIRRTENKKHQENAVKHSPRSVLLEVLNFLHNLFEELI